MKPVVVVDLDGTLYDSSARQHLAQAGEWEAFHDASIKDPPNQSVLDFLNYLPATIKIIGCTGRNDRHRLTTDNWMLKHGVPVDEVLMRPAEDFSSDTLIKPQLLLEWAEEEYPSQPLEELVWVVLEDRDKMVEMWRSMGLDCWQVNAGVY
jgi:FMN phosphatase YigB (HAD superfamily)